VEPELQPCGRTCETCPAAELCHTADDDGPDVDYAEVAAVLDGTHPGLEANVREDDLRPDYTDALAQAWDTLTVVTSCLADADAGLDDLVPLLDSIPGDELRRPWAHAVAASEHVRGAIRHLNQVRLPIRDDE
jgi:hypothetical protein